MFTSVYIQLPVQGGPKGEETFWFLWAILKISKICLLDYICVYLLIFVSANSRTKQSVFLQMWEIKVTTFLGHPVVDYVVTIMTFYLIIHI